MIRLFNSSLSGTSKVTITLDRFIRIPISQLPRVLLDEIKEFATHQDPVWVKQKLKGYQVSYDDRFLFSYRLSKDESQIFLSRGLLMRVKSKFSEYQIPYEIIDNRISLPPTGFEMKSDITFFDYQSRTIDDLSKEESALLDAACGSGKTVMGFGLIARLQQPTLVVVNTTEILNQWILDAPVFLNIRKSQVGEIAGGVHKIKPITIATFQSLNNYSLEDWTELNKKFGCIIFDESHHVSAESILEICNKSRAKFRFGFTATIKRKDEREFLIYDSISPKIIKIDDSELEDEGRLVSASVELIPHTGDIELSWMPIYIPGQEVKKYDINWGKIYTTIAENDSRTGLIVANIVRTVRMGHKCLILSPRTEHCEKMYRALIELVPSVALMIGKVKKDDRRDILKRAKAGDVDVIVATNNLAAEGLNIPCLSCLHLTAPTTNFNFIKQASGRIRRVFEDKLEPLVVDYVDIKSRLLVGMARSREKTYRKLEYKMSSSVNVLIGQDKI